MEQFPPFSVVQKFSHTFSWQRRGEAIGVVWWVSAVTCHQGSVGIRESADVPEETDQCT